MTFFFTISSRAVNALFPPGIARQSNQIHETPNLDKDRYQDRLGQTTIIIIGLNTLFPHMGDCHKVFSAQAPSTAGVSAEREFFAGRLFDQ